MGMLCVLERKNILRICTVDTSSIPIPGLVLTIAEELWTLEAVFAAWPVIIFDIHKNKQTSIFLNVLLLFGALNRSHL